MKKLIQGDYFKLFFLRESKVVLGHNYSNLWLLTAVLTLTFLAIAFSNASLKYLSFKMNDPFINWVDIKNEYGEGDINGLLTGLADTTVKEQYHFLNHQVDYSNHYMFFGRNENQVQYLGCRFFQSFEGNPLVQAILGEDNVVDGQSVPYEQLKDNLIGVIVTKDVLDKMGYEETPAFLDFCRYSAGADTLGFSLYQDFAKVPIPVLAVVKRLPMNMDIISTRFFYAQQRNDLTYPFNLNNASYAASAIFFLPDGLDVQEFTDKINEVGKSCFVSVTDLPAMRSFKKGCFVAVRGESEDLTPSEAFDIEAAVNEKYSQEGVKRVFDYDFKTYNLPMGAFVSVRFRDLGKIREFENFVKDNYKVRIEMSQINAKENFNAVSVTANILSWAIITFSIICIILFIVNLLRSYFQKVKRNMGTFKAFGISNYELICVYVLIMSVTVVCAILAAFCFVWLLQSILPALGILKDGMFNYLQLFNGKTYCAMVIILICSLLTVFFVMKRQLSATPGDLIYDRQ